MRIAIDVRSLMEGRHSGVEEYTVQIIRAMGRVAPEHEYHLFYNSARSVTLPWLGEHGQVHAFRFPNKVLNVSQMLLSWPRWDTLVSADCFFAPHMRLLPLTANVPLVVTAHDLSFEHFPELFSWRRRLWHKLMLPRLLMRNCDHVVAVSQATKADVVKLYEVPSDHVSVVYSGVRELAQVTSGDVRKKYKLPQRYVLYLGTLEPRKNVSSIIRAYDAIADQVSCDLVIAGAPGWLMGEVNLALDRAVHRSRIHMPGFIDEVDKGALYASADLFVYPSLYEGFGFPPLEALLAGTPVITSFNSSLPEVVGQWATLVDPYDISELALVMRELLGDLPKVSMATRRAVIERYSWDRAAKQTLAIIEQVV